jgi:hypothetical protein
MNSAAGEQTSGSSEQLTHSGGARQQPDLPSLLAQILECSQETSAPASDHPSLPLLQQVASRYPNAEISLQPIVTELVQTVIPPFRGMQPTDYSAMILQVARSLWDDPESRRRLGEFWGGLQRSIQRGG